MAGMTSYERTGINAITLPDTATKTVGIFDLDNLDSGRKGNKEVHAGNEGQKFLLFLKAALEKHCILKNCSLRRSFFFLFQVF